MYVEPEGYFTESMRKILEEGESPKTKKSPKKSAQKNTKKTKITIDDKWLSRIAVENSNNK